MIEKAQIACENRGNTVSNHFADLRKMVDIGSGAVRSVEDVGLSRYACYHFEVGKKVRKTIQELGGTMPEDLPTPEKGIGQIAKE